MEKKHNCEQCPMRAKFDQNPKKFGSRFWRWHIDFCPGWKAFFLSRTPEEQAALREKYNFTKYAH